MTMKQYQHHPYAYGFMLAVILLTILFMIGSCNVQQRREAKCLKWGVCAHQSDTLIIKDSVEIIKHETEMSDIFIDMLFTCDSVGNLQIRQIDSLSTVNADLAAKLKDGRLTIHGQVKTKVITIPVIHTRRFGSSVVIQKENYLTGWQWFQVWLGRVFAVIILVSLILFAIGTVRWLKRIRQ